MVAFERIRSQEWTRDMLCMSSTALIYSARSSDGTIFYVSRLK